MPALKRTPMLLLGGGALGLALMAVTIQAVSVSPRPQAVIDVGSRKQLFLDHRFIESMRGADDEPAVADR